MRTLAIATALTLVLSASGGAQTPWITLPAGTEYSLPPNDSPITSIRIPVAVLGDVKGVRVQVEDVRYAKRFDTSIAAAFDSIAFVPPRANFGGAIIVAVRPDLLVGPGAYILTLLVTAQSKDPARLSVQIVQPQAKLRVPTHEVLRILGTFGTPEVTNPQLRVSETGGESPLTKMSVMPVAPFRGDSGAIEGLVEADSNLVIPAKGTIGVPVRLKGAFPLGMTKGTIEIMGKELAQPFPVSVEIRTRRTHIYIFLFIAVGFGISFLSRLYLAGIQATGTAQLAVSEAIGAVAADTRNGDSTFRAARASALTELRTALTFKDPTKIKPAVDTALTAFNTARKDLDGGIGTAVTDATALHGLVVSRVMGTLELPPELKAQLDEVRFQRLNAFLSAGDLDAAQSWMASVRSAIGGPLDIRIEALKTAGGLFLVALESDAIGLPRSVLVAMKADAGTLRTKLDTLGTVDVDPSVAKLEAAFNGIQAAERAARRAVANIRLNLGRAVDDAIAALEVAAPASTAALHAGAGVVITSLEALESSPLCETELLPSKQLQNLDTAWQASTFDLLVADSAEQKAVGASIESHEYVDAARATAKALIATRSTAVPATTPLGDDKSVSPAGTASVSRGNLGGSVSTADVEAPSRRPCP